MQSSYNNSEIASGRPQNETTTEILLYHDKLSIKWKIKVIHERYPAELESEYVGRQTSLMTLINDLLHPEIKRFFVAIHNAVIKRTSYEKYVIKERTLMDNRDRLCGKRG